MNPESGMNRLSRQDRAELLQLFCEGRSIHAVTQRTGASKNTVSKLLVDAGLACAVYQDRLMRNLPCKRVQIDAIWSFVRVEDTDLMAGQVVPHNEGGVWTWIGIDTDTKLIARFNVGDRSYGAAKEFISGLAERLANRIQLASDDYGAYLVAVEEVLSGEIDDARLVKLFGQADTAHTNTSHMEFQNFAMHRFKRPTDSFSKKIENHACAVALHSMFNNFVRIRETTQVTPAIAVGVTDHLWEMNELVEMIEAFEADKKSQSD